MPKATILIVEDEAIVAEDLSQKLGRLGYEICGITAQGEEAVVLARDRRPDLVLMDIRLQGRMDGVEAAELIRREGGLPVIYLTAHSDRPTLQRAKLTEPFGYILKPFEELELETHIEMALYKHQTERKLRESEALYRAVGESINYGVWVCAPDGRNIYASPSFLQLVGLTQQQCLDFGWGNVLHPDDVERTIAAWKECVRTGGNWDIEHRFRGVDGQWHPILARGVPVRDEQGHITHWAGINLDISRIKQAEQALQRTAAMLEAIGKSTPDSIFVKDNAGRMLYASPGTLRLLNKTPDQVLGRVDTEWHPNPEEAMALMANDRKVMGSGQTQVIEEIFTDSQGKHTFLSTKSPLLDAAGKVVGLVGLSRDITERKQTEAALQASNNELQAFNDLMVGRELRMIELKKEIDELCVRFGQPPRYGYARGEKDP